MPLEKNIHFWRNQADIQALVSTHEIIILTKFHGNWAKIEDFFVISQLWTQSQISLDSLYLLKQKPKEIIP